MFNDRDLGILGAGALLAVLCLFLPLSFTARMVIGFIVLVSFMALALLRLGPDRVPPEVWLTRRARFAMQTRQYVNQQTASRRAERIPPHPTGPARQPTEHERPAPARQPQMPQAPMRPVDLAWNEVGVYPLLTALLGVVGVYFTVWLATGGAQELAFWFIWR